VGDVGDGHAFGVCFEDGGDGLEFVLVGVHGCGYWGLAIYAFRFAVRLCTA
jgi:hypothetical protein